MFVILLTLHLVAAALLILVVLLQSGKAGDLASAFGGATSQAAFGARGAATVLTKVTTVCAITFMLTSLGLAIYYSSESGASVMDSVETPPAVTEEVPSEGAPAEGTSTEEGSPAEGTSTDQPAAEGQDDSTVPEETGGESSQ
jgi:preprotein translocase subunit SecG